MKPHKHAELIKAWADGATIECNDCGVWYYAKNPMWQEDMEYRIKPEPKPDVVTKYYLEKGKAAYQCSKGGNLKVIWDGETGELKSVELLK